MTLSVLLFSCPVLDSSKHWMDTKTKAQPAKADTELNLCPRHSVRILQQSLQEAAAKLQAALVYDILSSFGGWCRKAMLGVWPVSLDFDPAQSRLWPGISLRTRSTRRHVRDDFTESQRFASRRRVACNAGKRRDWPVLPAVLLTMGAVGTARIP